MSELDAIKARAEYVSDKSLEAMSCHLAEVDIPALVAAVEAVLELHKPWKIHDCDCDYHTAESECDSEFMYTVCRECCTSNGYHTEECASEHIHGPTHPICPTVTAIHQALGEGE